MANTERLYVVAINGDVQIIESQQSEEPYSQVAREVVQDDLWTNDPKQRKRFGIQTLINRTKKNQRLEKKLRAEERLSVLCQNV